MSNINFDSRIRDAVRKATRGLQINRKDRDQMSDTGGSSYSRKEPEEKPPRDDMRKPFSKNNKPSDELDPDNDKDPDTDTDPDKKEGSENTAADKELEPIAAVDAAIDKILQGISQIEVNIDKIETTNEKEKDAIKRINELFETAINPYFADVLDAMKVFVGDK